MPYSINSRQQLRFKAKQTGRVIEHLVGLLSGILGGSCTLSGPPIVMWCVLKGWKKIEMHAVWARFFFSIALFSLLNLSINGMYNRVTVIFSLFLIPAVFLGFKTGTWIRDRFTEKRLRLYVLTFLFLSGLTGFALSFT